MAIVDQYGQPAIYRNRGTARSANLGGGDRPSEAWAMSDVSKLVPRWDRRMLVSASKTLYLNSPILIGAIDQKGMYGVGNSWLPVYKGGDTEWGRKATAWLEEDWYPNCNVVGDSSDFVCDLYVDSVGIDRDGEIFEYLTQSDDGFPQIQLIPSHRIDSGGLPEGPQLRGVYASSRYYLEDGIIYAINTNRPVAYSFCDVEGKHAQFIPAQSIKHVFDKSWPEQKRGLPLFYHSLNGLRDILQSEEWERMNLLSMSSLNYTIENEAGGPDMDEPDYVPSTCGEMGVQYLRGGQIMYARAGAGEKITQHQNFRPGNPWHEFYDLQVRMALTGVNWPVSMAWKPSGQGTAERNDIGKAERSVEDRQALLTKVAKWRVNHAIAYAMTSGMIPESADWWRWGFTKPKKITIDDGRTSKERLDKFRAGIINQGDMIGEEGNSFEDTIRRRGEEIAFVEMNRLEMEKKYSIQIDRRMYTLLTPNETPDANEQANPDNQ